MTVWCFYHSADFDGKCSGAIVKKMFPDCRMYGINYGEPFPWDEIKTGDYVYMVDFGLQPFEDMERLNGMCRLIWIDHHASAIEEAEKRGFACAGLRKIGTAGCELTWEYLYPESKLPLSVQLLGAQDVWRRDVFVEELKDIPGYEGIYAVSNLGRVYRYDRPIRNQNGITSAVKTGGWMALSMSSSGYPQVNLKKDGHQSMKFIHRLVAEAFVPRLSKALNEINHIDNNKTNNRVDNLEWTSRHQNVAHSILNGNKQHSSIYHGVCVLKPTNKYRARVQVDGKRMWIGSFDSEIEAAEAYDKFVKENGFNDIHGIPLNFPYGSSLSIESSSGNHWDTLVLPFQYGFRLLDTDPNNQALWSVYLTSDERVSDVIKTGKMLVEYEELQNAAYARAAAFEVELDGLKCIAINRGLGGSLMFKSVYDPAKHDAMLAFYRNSHHWMVSLYADKPDVDVSKVCKARGGGGHKGAAGFECKELPF